MRLWIGLALSLAAFVGCADDDGASSAEPSAPAAAPFAPRADIDPRLSRTVVLLVVDGLSPGDVEPEPWLAARMDALPSLAAGGTLHPRAVAASTGGNAALASILTGLAPAEHGVLSVREPGHGRLDDRVTTLAETFVADNWVTVASVASGREARGVGGFAQGFTAFDSPGSGALYRDASSVVLGLGGAARGSLGGGGPLMLFATFADASSLGRFGDEVTPRTKLAAEVVARRFGLAAQVSAELDELVRGLESDPAASLRQLQTRFSRARGSGDGRLWRQALRDLWLLELDGAIGEVLTMLEESGRAEAAHIFVAGLRADDSFAEAREGAPRLREERLVVPLLHRAPGSVGGGARRADIVPMAELASYVKAALGGLDQPDRSHRIALTQTTLADVHGAFAAGPDGGLLHLERFPDGQTVHHTAVGPVLSFDDAGPMVRRMAETLGASARPATVTFAGRDGAAPSIAARWRLDGGGASVLGAERYRPRVRGTIEAGGDGPVTLALKERGGPVRVTIEEPEMPRGMVRIGATPMDALPVMFAPAESAVPTAALEPGAPQATLEFVRDGGLNWSVRVRGEGPVEALFSVWPPRGPGQPLEFVPGPEMTVTEVGARRDLLHVKGVAPFEMLLKRRGVEEFTAACLHGGRFLGPDDMVSDGARFEGVDGYDFILPAWQPAASPALADVAAAAYGPALEPSPRDAALVITRRGFGPVPGINSGRDFVARELVKRLPATE